MPPNLLKDTFKFREGPKMPLLLCKEGYHNASCLACCRERGWKLFSDQSTQMNKANLAMNAVVMRACVMENLWQACGRLVVVMWACGRHVEGMYVAALTE